MVLQTKLYIWFLNDLLSRSYPVFSVEYTIKNHKATGIANVKRSNKERTGV